MRQLEPALDFIVVNNGDPACVTGGNGSPFQKQHVIPLFVMSDWLRAMAIMRAGNEFDGLTARPIVFSRVFAVNAMILIHVSVAAVGLCIFGFSAISASEG
jgi:hypothetical protein